MSDCKHFIHMWKPNNGPAFCPMCEVEQLRTKNERLQRDLDSALRREQDQITLRNLNNEQLAAAIAERDEMIKDVERMNWLGNKDGAHALGYPSANDENWYIFTDDLDFQGKTFREVVDAAIASMATKTQKVESTKA